MVIRDKMAEAATRRTFLCGRLDWWVGLDSRQGCRWLGPPPPAVSVQGDARILPQSDRQQLLVVIPTNMPCVWVVRQIVCCPPGWMEVLDMHVNPDSIFRWNLTRPSSLPKGYELCGSGPDDARYLMHNQRVSIDSRTLFAPENTKVTGMCTGTFRKWLIETWSYWTQTG